VGERCGDGKQSSHVADVGSPLLVRRCLFDERMKKAPPRMVDSQQGQSGGVTDSEKLDHVGGGSPSPGSGGRRCDDGSIGLERRDACLVDPVAGTAGTIGREVRGGQFAVANPGQNLVRADTPLAGQFGRRPGCLGDGPIEVRGARLQHIRQFVGRQRPLEMNPGDRLRHVAEDVCSVRWCLADAVGACAFKGTHVE